MYTWGYIKDASLAKLDLTESEATVQNLISRFPFYANEVITQVCSTVKPKYTFQEFVIDKDMVGHAQDMPDDFVSFGDDVCYELVDACMWNGQYREQRTIKREITSEDFEYCGHSQVIFKRAGSFYISYNARWFTFDKQMDDSAEIPVPNDILECIPSYIASQCFKIDDEYKASVFRNEYEIMLARIDNTNYKEVKSIVIEGGW